MGTRKNKTTLLLLSSVFLLFSCGGNPSSSSDVSSITSSDASSKESAVSSTSGKQEESGEETVSPEDVSSSDVVSSEESLESSAESPTSSEDSSASEEILSSEEIVTSNEDATSKESSEEEVISSEEIISSEEESSVEETKYNIITIAPAGYRFEFEDDIREYKEGDTVTMTAVNTNAAYQIKRVYYYGADTSKLETIAGIDGVYTFTMPAENITIKGEAERYYSLSLDAIGCEISLTSEIKQYYRYDAITFEVTPNEGYVIERVYLTWLEAEEEPYGEKTFELSPLEDGTYSFSSRTGAMTIHAKAKEDSIAPSEDPFVESEFQGDYTGQDYYRSSMVLQVKFDGLGKIYWAIYYVDSGGWDDWGEYEAYRPAKHLNTYHDLDDTTTYILKVSSNGFIEYTYDSQTGNITFGGNSMSTTIVNNTVTAVTALTNFRSDSMYATRGCVCTII